MRDHYEERTIVSTHVAKYMNINSNLLPQSIVSDDQKYLHVLDIGTSIMCLKWKVGYGGGSFAEAVVDNNLTKSFGYADETCVQAIKFYVVMINNLDMPSDIVSVRLNEDYDKYNELTRGLH